MMFASIYAVLAGHNLLERYTDRTWFARLFKRINGTNMVKVRRYAVSCFDVVLMLF